MARADKDDEDVPESEGGGSSKKMLIIIAALLVAVVLIIGGVLLYKKSSSSDSSSEHGEEKKSESHGKKREPPVIYSLEPFVVNIRDNADIRYLKLKIEFGIKPMGKESKGEHGGGGEAKGELDPYLPRLRDSILLLLTSKTLGEIQDVNGKMRLRQEIMSSASRILPRGTVKEVFFTDFVVQ